MLPFVPVKDGQKDLTFVVTVVQFCLGKCGFGILLFLESWKLETKEFSGCGKTMHRILWNPNFSLCHHFRKMKTEACRDDDDDDEDDVV